MSEFKLYPFQQADVDQFMADPTKGGLNGSVVGTGKTPIATEILNRSDASGTKVNLILAPPNTRDGWERANRLQHRPRALRQISKSATGKAAMADLKAGVAGDYFSSYEFARQFAFDGYVKQIDAVIFDEVHRASNHKTATWQLTNEINTMVQRVDGIRLGLSGTPAGNQPDRIYGVATSLWGPRDITQLNPSGNPIINSYWQWGGQFFPTERSTKGGNEVFEFGPELVPGSAVSSLPLYWRHEQNWACCAFHPQGVQTDLPQRVVHTVKVDMTPTQQKLYDQLEKDMFTWVEDNNYPIITEGLPMLQWLRLLQIAMAVPTTEIAQRLKVDAETGEKEMVDFVKVSYALDAKSSKIDAVLDIMADVPAGEPVLIFTHSAGIIPAVVERLRKKGFTAEGWHGAVSASQRAGIKEKFLASNGTVQVIVAQIGAMAEGVDGLQRVCAYEIWMSQSANRFQNTQALGRLRRDGQTRVINSWAVVADNTLEPEQYEKMFDADQRMVDSLHVRTGDFLAKPRTLNLTI